MNCSCTAQQWFGQTKEQKIFFIFDSGVDNIRYTEDIPIMKIIPEVIYNCMSIHNSQYGHSSDIKKFNLVIKKTLGSRHHASKGSARL